MLHIIRICVLLFVVCLPALTSDRLNADHLGRLIGYTVVAATTVSGNFEGADYDKLVKLDNGMIFEFREYSYTYSYRPDAVVLAKAIDVPPTGRQALIYKLVVDDEIYDVTRVK